MNIVRTIKRNMPTILAIVASAGVVGTAVLSGKASIKASANVQKAKREKEVVTKIEVVKIAAPSYILTAVCGVTTIACIIGSNTLNRKQIASLIGAYALLKKSYDEYQNKVRELYGDDDPVRNAIVQDRYTDSAVSDFKDDETLLFYDEYHEEFFHRKMIEVLDAEYQLNRKFVTDGEASLNDFFRLLGLPETEEGDILGWSLEACCDFFAFTWIDFQHPLIKMEDGMECHILEFVSKPFAGYAYRTPPWND